MTAPLPIDHPGLPEDYMRAPQRLRCLKRKPVRVTLRGLFSALGLIVTVALLLAVIVVFGFSVGIVSGCLK